MLSATQRETIYRQYLLCHGICPDPRSDPELSSTLAARIDLISAVRRYTINDEVFHCGATCRSGTPCPLAFRHTMSITPVPNL
jgi:hypothetical protein